jgi:hypothetical protein
VSEPPSDTDQDREPDPDATVAGAAAPGGPDRAGPPAAASPTRTHVGIDAYLATGTVLAGRYRIEGIVGVGGMGIV